MGKRYRDKSWLKQKYIKEDKTQSEIAEICGVTRSAIGNWCQKYDLNEVGSAYFGTDANGYEVSQSRIDDELSTVKVHRLLAVAEYGFNNLKNKDVHHKNDIPWDNRPDNIEILSHEEHGRVSANKRWKNGS